MPNLSGRRQHAHLLALGGAIKRLRVARSYSQCTLAVTAGVDLSYLGRVERGDNNVAFLTLTKIAVALGVSVVELLKEADIR